VRLDETVVGGLWLRTRTHTILKGGLVNDHRPDALSADALHRAPGAIDFLERAFGFARREVITNPDGTVAHAELALGPSVLMLGSDRDDPRLGRRAGAGWIYVAVADADEHCQTPRREGAEIIVEP
jgi:uncharacterized glyoxalase superfamily protein PhnB